MSLKMDRIFWVHGFRVQTSRRPESSHSGSKRPGVQNPSDRSPSVLSSRVQASMHRESERLVVQSPSVQTMRPGSNFSGEPNKAYIM